MNKTPSSPADPEAEDATHTRTADEPFGVEPATRWCVSCGQIKPLTLEHFAKDRALKFTGGFARKCRDCSSSWGKRKKYES